MEYILTHENADFDAIAGLLAAHKLNPDARPVLPAHLNQNVSRFITLYQNGLPFTSMIEARLETATRIILLDTQRMTQKGVPANTPVHVIDHHTSSRQLPSHYTLLTESVGAVTTLLVEQIREKGIHLSSLESTLLLLGIYEDTGSLTYGTTTPRDLLAAAWLLSQQASLDDVRRFLTPPLNDEQQTLFEQLTQQVDIRAIAGYTVALATISIDHQVSEISSVAHRLRDLLDTAALFVLVKMPRSLHLVARSSEEAVDVGAVARRLGGGGHSRAAAASIQGRSLEEVVSLIWDDLAQHITPVQRVADLMSFGVQTVMADSPLVDVVDRLQRIGHEGYPVMDDGRVVGLLTRRDSDRALSHGLQLRVRDVMMAGNITLTPDDPVSELERKMVESGWGQIPVVDNSGLLIGIVTRTDLIKYWSRLHPSLLPAVEHLTVQQLETVLGQPTTALILQVASQAQAQNARLYLVGGVVRDVLLSRPNFDVDFVIEGDAIAFADSLQQLQGGVTHSFKPFGTAKWFVQQASDSSLPDHVDFASARYEFYQLPAALPTVYNGSIKLDLQRRDFTINTLAVQLSPASSFGQVLDFYGGLPDLGAKQIRVLHSLSFIDDPTRILRALRFEHRLGFTIEPRTRDLMQVARPMLQRVTGERLRNELNLLLEEDHPEVALLRWQEQGWLQVLHPALVLDEKITEWFQFTRTSNHPWPWETIRQPELDWHVLLIGIAPAELEKLCDRLLFPHRLTESMVQSAQLWPRIHEPVMRSYRPSEMVDMLKDVTECGLLAIWMRSQSGAVRDLIRRYWLEWRLAQPIVTGTTLRELGLKPGPCYGIILSRLRMARLDGEVQTEADELRLVRRLVDEEGACHGRA